MHLIPTTVVGSYVQPDWLINRDMLKSAVPPRIRMREIWNIAEDNLQEAQDAATLAAIRDMEDAGIDIITDGEIRRESYSNHFTNALSGIVSDPPGMVTGRSGRQLPVPRITGPIKRKASIETRDARFLKANTSLPVKFTLPGPFTMAQQAIDEYYDDEHACIMAFAEAVNEEVLDLFAAGVDVVQLDEPWVQARSEDASGIAVKAINRALEGATGTTSVHLCFGYAHAVKDKPDGYSFLPELNNCNADQISIEAAQPDLDLAVLEALKTKTIILGAIDLGDDTVETAETVAGRIRHALDYLPAERLIAAPDCGMKYLSRQTAIGKLKALADGAEIVRTEIS